MVLVLSVDARKARKKPLRSAQAVEPQQTRTPMGTHLTHGLPAQWETGTVRELRAHARYAGVGQGQLDDAADTADIISLVRKVQVAQSEDLGSQSTFNAVLTDQFIRALVPTTTNRMGDLTLALRILTTSPGQVDPNSLYPYGSHSVPALSHAVRFYLFAAYKNPGSDDANTAFALVQALVEAGAATAGKDYRCVPALTYAAFFKSVRLVKLLVDHGARCDVAMEGPRTVGYSPLHAAVEIDPRNTMATLAKLYESVRHGLIRRIDKRYWNEVFPKPTEFAGVPSGQQFYDGFEFDAYGSLFSHAASGDETFSFKASDSILGLQEWTGATVDLLLNTNTCNFDQRDLKGRTALHQAAMFGNLRAVEVLLSAGAPTHILDTAGFSALHYAARRGYAEVVATLEAASGAVMGSKGLFGLLYSDVQARKYAETRPWKPSAERDLGGWRGGSDSDELLLDYCDMPEIEKEDFTGELFGRYIVANKPFIVRGYGLDWKMRTAWRRDNFLRKYGDLRFETGAIGYASTLGFEAPEMSVSEYVEYMESDNKEYNNTLYIFQNGIARSHPELTGDFDQHPDIVKQIPQAVGFQSAGESAGKQFYLGPKDTGAQPHTHNHAWNMMAYGRKLWYMWSPDAAFYTTIPSRPYIDRFVRQLPTNERPMSCIQEAGDFVYVPAGWGHTALNLEDSIGIAIGFRDAYSTPFYTNDKCMGYDALQPINSGGSSSR